MTVPVLVLEVQLGDEQHVLQQHHHPHRSARTRREKAVHVVPLV